MAWPVHGTSPNPAISCSVGRPPPSRLPTAHNPTIHAARFLAPGQGWGWRHHLSYSWGHTARPSGVLLMRMGSWGQGQSLPPVTSARVPTWWGLGGGGERAGSSYGPAQEELTQAGTQPLLTASIWRGAAVGGWGALGLIPDRCVTSGKSLVVSGLRALRVDGSVLSISVTASLYPLLGDLIKNR